MGTVFVVAGSPDALAPHAFAPGDGDFVIAADRGAAHARGWGWPVDLLVGDLDSLPANLARQEVAAGTPIVRVPAAKDQTDTELALQYALDRQPAAIVICGALGGRTDHLLANVLLLARPDLAGLNVCIADGPDTIRLLSAGKGPAVALIERARAGDLLTLLPLNGAAEGITTTNLQYPLDGETLYTGSARGVSNVLSDEQAVIGLGAGNLLIVHHAME